MKHPILLLLLAVTGGCRTSDGGFDVLVTVRAGASLSEADVQSIRTLSISLGDSGLRDLRSIDAPLSRDRDLVFGYRAPAERGRLSVAVSASDPAAQVVAAAETQIVVDPLAEVTAQLVLE